MMDLDEFFPDELPCIYRCACGAPLPRTGRKGRPRKRCATCAEAVRVQRLLALKIRGALQ